MSGNAKEIYGRHQRESNMITLAIIGFGVVVFIVGFVIDFIGFEIGKVIAACSGIIFLITPCLWCGASCGGTLDADDEYLGMGASPCSILPLFMMLGAFVLSLIGELLL